MYMGEENDPPSAVGHNPPYGASINYYLGSAATSEVQIEIADAAGHTIKTLTGGKDAGLNRVWWDLKREQTRQPRLRTSPIGHPEIGLRADGSRAFPVEGRFAPLVAPGTYAVTLKIGRTEVTRQLEVKRDPNSLGSEDGIRLQTTLALEIWNQMNTMTDLIDRIETVRWQIAEIKPSLQSDARWKSHIVEADDLERKLLAIEKAFFDPKITSASDAFYYPPGLYSKMDGLARGITESDYQPTAAQGEVASMFSREVSAHKDKLDAIMRSDVAAFNERLKGANVPHIGTQ
jgi:hypothetical protein